MRSRLGLCDSRLGLCDSLLGLCDSWLGLCDSRLGLNDSRLGPCDSRHGPCDSRHGLGDSWLLASDVLGSASDVLVEVSSSDIPGSRLVTFWVLIQCCSWFSASDFWVLGRSGAVIDFCGLVGGVKSVANVGRGGVVYQCSEGFYAV